MQGQELWICLEKEYTVLPCLLMKEKDFLLGTTYEKLYLGIEYIAVYGIGYVDAIESLADDVAAFYAE